MSQKRRPLTLKRSQEKSGSRSPILAFYRCSSAQIYLDHDTILTLDSTKINVVTSFTLEIFVWENPSATPAGRCKDGTPYHIA
jgi:Fe-S cluster assembly iron-binding protein IscA